MPSYALRVAWSGCSDALFASRCPLGPAGECCYVSFVQQGEKGGQAHSSRLELSMLLSCPGKQSLVRLLHELCFTAKA